jgi:SAM-dependent methyltransferase
MNLLDLVGRQPEPEPWAEGEKIPWDDPAFSRRMLNVHLSQQHDLASRRFAVIDRHVAWIHRRLLAGRPARVLDLGCGPGLYTSRLCRLGHTCVGIDFGPAAIGYAREQAEAEGLRCRYTEADIRSAEYGTGYDLAMLVYGEFNVFRPADAQCILVKAQAALNPGGLLLLEVQRAEAVQALGQAPASWYSARCGLFSDRPHLCLSEAFWDEDQQVATERYWIVDALSGEVTRHASSTQSYSTADLGALLASGGFGQLDHYPSLTGQDDATSDALTVVVARKE